MGCYTEQWKCKNSPESHFEVSLVSDAQEPISSQSHMASQRYSHIPEKNQPLEMALSERMTIGVCLSKVVKAFKMPPKSKSVTWEAYLPM